MSEKKRVIKRLCVNENDEITIFLQGRRDAIRAKVLERTPSEDGQGESYLLDRLIHQEGEVFVVEKDRQETKRFILGGCYVTKLVLAA